MDFQNNTNNIKLCSIKRRFVYAILLQQMFRSNSLQIARLQNNTAMMIVDFVLRNWIVISLFSQIGYSYAMNCLLTLL